MGGTELRFFTRGQRRLHIIRWGLFKPKKDKGRLALWLIMERPGEKEFSNEGVEKKVGGGKGGSSLGPIRGTSRGENAH